MDDVFSLYQELHEAGVNCYDWELGEEPAMIIELGNKYALFVDLSDVDSRGEEAVIVAHEAGHIFTGALHRMNSPYDLISKHEYKADAWAYRRLVPPARLREAYRQGCREPWEVADYLGLPQSFVERAVRYYRTQSPIAS